MDELEEFKAGVFSPALCQEAAQLMHGAGSPLLR
jgi:hypothetical protein